MGAGAEAFVGVIRGAIRGASEGTIAGADRGASEGTDPRTTTPLRGVRSSPKGLVTQGAGLGHP
jgi:hypothetical protein